MKFTIFADLSSIRLALCIHYVTFDSFIMSAIGIVHAKMQKLHDG